MARMSIGNIPPEAMSRGAINPAIPQEQKKPEGAAETSGPRIGQKGEYLPATYKTSRGKLRTDR